MSAIAPNMAAMFRMLMVGERGGLCTKEGGREGREGGTGGREGGKEVRTEGGTVRKKDDEDFSL